MTQPFAEAQHQPTPAPAVTFRAATPEEIATAEKVRASASTGAPTEPVIKVAQRKLARTAILEDGVWKPFKLFSLPKKEKESELRAGFGHHSATVDEIQLDIERTEASLAFLKEQIAAQELRLKGLRIELGKSAEDAARYLRSMTDGTPLRVD